jgi:hypothetical protein
MSEDMNAKSIDILIMEHKRWLSRQEYWAKNVMQIATIILSISTISLSISNESNLHIILWFVVASVLTLIVPSTFIYFYMTKKSKKRLGEIEEDLDYFGVHLGYQRTFDNVNVPKYRDNPQREEFRE